MTDLFVSYSRDDTVIMSVIRDNLRKLGFTLWIDVEHLKPGTPQWMAAVKQAVVRTDGMLVLCSPSAEQSKWVNIEITIAEELGKPIFPIWVNGREKIKSIPLALFNYQFVDMRGRSDAARGFTDLAAWLAESYGLDIPDYDFDSYTGLVQLPTIHITNVTNHVEGSIVNIEGDVVGDVNVAGRDINATTVAEPEIHPEPEPVTEAEPEEYDEPEPEPTPVPVMAAPPAPATQSVDPGHVNMSRAVSTAPTTTQTQQQDTNQMGLWLGLGGVGLAVVVGGILLALGGGSGGNDSEPTQRAVVVETDEPTEVAEEKPQTIETPEEEEPEPTEETPEVTPTPDIPTEEQLALEGVSGNGDWSPYIQEFNGVEMALVPVGCFMMGSEDGDSDEGPVHEVCFDDPFWIDVYEVTNEQYGSAAIGEDSYNDDCESRSSADSEPRNCVNWTDSAAHCENRGVRLPTEAEWEYAARGPDSLVYPWGNEFIADNAVYAENVPRGTAPVGSREGGLSWVGAYDMSGNVSEWVADWYDSEYYSVSPETNPQGPDDGEFRVKRGGSFGVNASLLRAAGRNGNAPAVESIGAGFRCARSYNP